LKNVDDMRWFLRLEGFGHDDGEGLCLERL